MIRLFVEIIISLHYKDTKNGKIDHKKYNEEKLFR